ncbi:COL21A1, partial [Symbiodinium sp. KB8]
MAELVSAGCGASWKKGNFKVVHPVWGELRTTIRGGCPELAQAARLVNEIEDKKLKELKDGVSLLKSKLEHLVHEEKLPWTTYVERYLEGGLAKDLWKALQGSFMKILSEHMLDPLCQGIRLGEGWNHLKDLPFPRRLRKRMLDSTRWVVHLPVHRDEEQPKAEEYGPDAVVVNVPGNANGKGTSFVCGWKASETYNKNWVTGMRESELNLGKFGAPGRKPLIATTNYHLDGLTPRSTSEDQHVALGGPLKAMTPEKWKEHAAKMKYLLVAKFTIPESYVTGEFEPTGSDPLDEEVGSKDLFDEEDKVSTGGDDGPTDGAGGEDRDPGEAVVEHEPLDAEEGPEGVDTGAGVGPIPLDVKAPKATYKLFAEPLLNDKGPTIASAIQSIVLYLQSLNIPVLRFHSDRAAQLTARPLVQWLHQQAIRTSTSTPGVPQGNGAAESAVKELKLRTRKTLSTSGLEKPFWPVAAKAVASMQRAR